MKRQLRGRHKQILIGTRNQLEPTFWVQTRNPEPIIYLKAGSRDQMGLKYFRFS